MGRQRRVVAGYEMDGSPKPLQAVVERRLGHLNPVCADCKKKNPMGANKCVKCGKDSLRRSAKAPTVGFRDD